MVWPTWLRATAGGLAVRIDASAGTTRAVDDASQPGVFARPPGAPFGE